MRNASWSVIQALVAAGHTLPKPLNRFAIRGAVHAAPLSVVRWLLQHGMSLDTELLTHAAQADRVDILQLAHAQGAPIAAEVIEAATASGKWEAVVWACRNGVAFDIDRVQLRLRNCSSKPELLAMLQDMRTRGGLRLSRDGKRKR